MGLTGNCHCTAFALKEGWGNAVLHGNLEQQRKSGTAVRRKYGSSAMGRGEGRSAGLAGG